MAGPPRVQHESALCLQGLHPQLLWCIAEKLGSQGSRVRLAATCRTLRLASVCWFRDEIIELDTDEPTPPQRLCWLCRVHAPLHLILGENLCVINFLTAGGARIVELSVLDDPSPELEQVPAELAGLTQLSKLSLNFNPIAIAGGWQHLPRQLRRLRLVDCELEEVPADLAGLAQLTYLDLSINLIEGGWLNVPGQLEQLKLTACGLQQVPPELRGLAQLTDLALSVNNIEAGWQHLPPRLLKLNIHNCSLHQVPAELAGLADLSELSLGRNPIEGGWQHLPRQLQELGLSDCGIRQVPAELAGLTQLRRLDLSGNTVEGGWQHLPRQLQELDLSGLAQLPADLAARMEQTGLRVNV